MSAADDFDYPTMARALIIGDKDTVARKTREGLDLAMDPKALIFKGLIPGMDVVGEKFRRNEYYVPQVLLSARAMYAGYARDSTAAVMKAKLLMGAEVKPEEVAP